MFKKEQIPIVSVCMITYGHEKFIREAIEGVLMQNCNFQVELIIANDSSPDKTHETIENLMEENNSSIKIKYFRHNKNIGMMPNFIFALKQGKGKYIALCEGDDYWTDPLKLQKQVDFLESNSEFVIHSGCAKIQKEEDKFYCEIIGGSNEDRILSLVDFHTRNDLITCTVVFRNIKMDFPEFYNTVTFGDWLLYVFLIEKTNLKVFCSKEVFSVYRVSKSGIMSSLSEIYCMNLHIEQIQLIKKYIGYIKFSSLDKKNINNYLIKKYRLLLEDDLFFEGMKTLLFNFKYCGFNISFRKYLSGVRQYVLKKQ
jgi:glycosyltransferase involved in cell wall biosynthesis